MTDTKLPQPMQVRDMLCDLLGRDVLLQVCNPIELSDPAYYAVYVDDRVRTSAVVFADLPMAAYSGAAIGLVPPGGAADAVDEKKLPPMLADNFSEILNVMAALFNAEGAPHLRLYNSYPPSEAPPADVVGHARALGARLDFEVKVHGYGLGLLGIVLTF
jgi:hypothetical protein